MVSYVVIHAVRTAGAATSSAALALSCATYGPRCRNLTIPAPSPCCCAAVVSTGSARQDTATLIHEAFEFGLYLVGAAGFEPATPAV